MVSALRGSALRGSALRGCVLRNLINHNAIGYYLVDGIYPKWASFVQSFREPETEKKAYFSQMQEAVRKDIERAFGVLKGRWHILARPALGWHRSRLIDIMETCIILHNMIIEDQGSQAIEDVEPIVSELSERKPECVALHTLVQNNRTLRDSLVYHQLRGDLVEHLWTWKGNQ